MCTVTLRSFKQFSIFKQVIITAIVFTFIFKSVHLQQCSKLAFNKKHFGQRLVGFNISTTTEDSIGTCVKKCFQLTHCLSTNFNTVSKECDLNNITTDDMTAAVVKSGMSVLSDLRVWPKAMLGSCGDKPCHGHDICLPAGNSFLCRDSDCPNAPSFRDTTSTGSVEYGGKIVYTCIHSYHRVFGPDYLQCGWMSTWPNVAINCSVGQVFFSQTDPCTAVAPQNGAVTETAPDHGAKTTYFCNAGYTISGTATQTCTAGRLSDSAPTCNGDPCTAVAPRHGAVTETAPAHGTTTKYSCTTARYHGYTLSGTATQTCTAGRLSDSAPTCNAVCPDDWTRYYDSCYVAGGGNSMTFSGTVNYCEGFGADIVQLESANENQFVKNNLLRNVGSHYWLGLTDGGEEGVWRWYKTYKLATYFDWGSGEPDGSSDDKDDEDCVAYNEQTYRWNDVKCQNEYLPTCELRLAV